MRHRRFVAFITLTFLGIATSPNYANATNEQSRLQQLRDSINELRQEIGSDKEQHSQLQKEMRRLEREIVKANRRLRDIEAQITQQRQTQQQLQTEALNLNQKLEQQKQTLAKQLRASFSPNEQQALKLLLNQSSPAEAGRTLAYYSYFSRAQQQTIADTRENIAALQETDEKLQQSRDKLETLKRQQQEERSKLSARQKEQKALLSKLDSRIQGNEQNLTSMLADEQALTKLIQELSAKHSREKRVPAPSKTKGSLQWPLQGKIEHSFGDSRNQGRMVWQGVMINGKDGQEVHSIAPGKVVFADWMRGYGLLMIIDHGNDLMSLYGHNQSLYKETGDNVSANETIAVLGGGDNSDEPGLYFELRHKGKPVDPEKWLQ